MLHSRREFLHLGAAAGASAFLPWDLPGQEARIAFRPKVAAIYTVFRHRSHAHNILNCFLRPYLFNGRVVEPRCDVVSFYADQRVPEGDMTDEVARQFKVRNCKTIEEALTLGGKQLAVDAVLSIGEHGDYPDNKLGQREYPRKRFFDEILAVMQRSNRFVPLFNDKHLSYRWDWSKEMYDTARKHRIPFIAGSSVPLAQRIEELELPLNCDIEEAVSIHGGPKEIYDFHAFEVLQAMIERRKGGETGISSVEMLSGEALWQAADKGRFSMPLVEAALGAEFRAPLPNPRRPIPNEKEVEAHGLLLTYKDGLRATILKLGANSQRWNFACRLKGERQAKACKFYPGPWGNRNLFMALSHSIHHTFVTSQEPYPLERTLLASGVVDAGMHSNAQAGRRIATPHLEFAYTTRDWRAFREMGESWKRLEKLPETKGIDPIGDLK